MRLLSLQTAFALNLTDSKTGMAVRMKKDRIKKNVAKSVDLFGGSSKSMTVAKEDGRVHCMIPMIACIKRGEPLPTSVQNQGVKMCCTNSKCQFASQFVHADCFKQLENTLIKIISNLGSARGWTDIQRRNNLWEKKGLTLVQKNLRCECGLGLMTRDADFYKKLDENGTATPVEIKGKKKKKKELPKLNYTNNGAIPVDNAEIYKKKYSDADCHYRDDSFDDGNMSIASTDTGLGWQKSNGLQFETPKRSAQLKNHQVVTPVSVWKTVPSAAPAVVTTPIKKSSLPPQVAIKNNGHHLPANNDPESLPEISPPIVNSQRKASTPTLPLASWTSIVQSSLVPATVELPVNTSNFNQRKQQQREFAASIAGQCGSMAGSARNILVYTLFGNNAPSFLLVSKVKENFLSHDLLELLFVVIFAYMYKAICIKQYQQYCEVKAEQVPDVFESSQKEPAAKKPTSFFTREIITKVEPLPTPNSCMEKLLFEITSYNAENTEPMSSYPLTYRQKNVVRFPILSNAARRYLSAPSTSVVSE